jgi:Na+/H+ antiporter NhaC
VIWIFPAIFAAAIAWLLWSATNTRSAEHIDSDKDEKERIGSLVLSFVAALILPPAIIVPLALFAIGLSLSAGGGGANGIGVAAMIIAGTALLVFTVRMISKARSWRMRLAALLPAAIHSLWFLGLIGKL